MKDSSRDADQESKKTTKARDESISPKGNRDNPMMLSGAGDMLARPAKVPLPVGPTVAWCVFV
jgi:hypothetical protein